MERAREKHIEKRKKRAKKGLERKEKGKQKEKMVAARRGPRTSESRALMGEESRVTRPSFECGTAEKCARPVAGIIIPLKVLPRMRAREECR